MVGKQTYGARIDRKVIQGGLSDRVRMRECTEGKGRRSETGKGLKGWDTVRRICLQEWWEEGSIFMGDSRSVWKNRI